jgi:hypothetical protein
MKGFLEAEMDCSWPLFQSGQTVVTMYRCCFVSICWLLEMLLKYRGMKHASDVMKAELNEDQFVL